MQSLKYIAAACAATLLTPTAHAQSTDNVAALRRDVENLRQEYERRIADLEARLAQAEAAAGQEFAPPPMPPDEVMVVDAAPAAPAPASANPNPNIYNPGIAVALNGFLTAASEDAGGETIAGFAVGDEIGRPARGFSLGESEISFSANIDPFLAGFLSVAVGAEHDVALEEAYVRTTALPGGFTIKAGRFLSGIAYLNERHAHDWNFSDAPLPYRAFLNTQLGDDGVQLRWIAPTDQFLEFGVEAFRGDSYPAAGAANNGIGAYSAFVRTGADIDASTSYLAALSYLHARSLDRDSAGDLFSGDSDLGVLTLVYKWAPNGNPVVRNLTLAGEYFYGEDQGLFNGLAFDQAHSGWYLQGVYQFMPSWSAGPWVRQAQAGAPA